MDAEGIVVPSSLPLRAGMGRGTEALPAPAAGLSLMDEPTGAPPLPPVPERELSERNLGGVEGVPGAAGSSLPGRT